MNLVRQCFVKLLNSNNMATNKLTQYKDCYDLIKDLENSEEVKAGSKSSFAVVRNFLANKIAEMI